MYSKRSTLYCKNVIFHPEEGSNAEMTIFSTSSQKLEREIHSARSYCLILDA